MDVEITPEPTAEEREALLTALHELKADPPADPGAGAWARLAGELDDDA